MSHIRCPMCGLASALSRFDPTKLDKDIYIRSVRGLGRGAGFAAGPDISVLGDDDITSMVKDRCFELIQLFLEKGIISNREIMTRLGLGIQVEGIINFLTYEELLDYNEGLVEDLRKKISDTNTINTQNQLKHNKLREKYESLVKRFEEKEIVDNNLKKIHLITNAEIILDDNEWKLKISNIDKDTLHELCRLLYTLNVKTRIARARI
jgi:hypothetical protein